MLSFLRRLKSHAGATKGTVCESIWPKDAPRNREHRHAKYVQIRSSGGFFVSLAPIFVIE